MVLATRPLLFCFLKIQFQSSDACRESLNSSSNVRKLLHVCVDSAQQMLNILCALHAQSILGKLHILSLNDEVHQPLCLFRQFPSL